LPPAIGQGALISPPRVFVFVGLQGSFFAAASFRPLLLVTGCANPFSTHFYLSFPVQFPSLLFISSLLLLILMPFLTPAPPVQMFSSFFSAFFKAINLCLDGIFFQVLFTIPRVNHALPSFLPLFCRYFFDAVHGFFPRGSHRITLLFPPGLTCVVFPPFLVVQDPRLTPPGSLLLSVFPGPSFSFSFVAVRCPAGLIRSALSSGFFAVPFPFSLGRLLLLGCCFFDRPTFWLFSFIVFPFPIPNATVIALGPACVITPSMPASVRCEFPFFLFVNFPHDAFPPPVHSCLFN